jgi:hypothetical protein
MTIISIIAVLGPWVRALENRTVEYVYEYLMQNGDNSKQKSENIDVEICRIASGFFGYVTVSLTFYIFQM